MPYGGLDGQLAIRENRLVETVTVKLIFSQRGLYVPVCELHEGDIMLKLRVNSLVTFNGSGTDLLRIGISGATEKYMADTSIATTGVIACAATADLQIHETADQAVVALYTDTNGDSTAGSLLITAIIARCVIP